jgi:hypothetical protein
MRDEDIEGAICRSRQQCAIARTIYRQLDEPVGRVHVMTSGVSVAKGEYRYYYRVPRIACLLVRNFDDGKEVKPINFALYFTDRRKISPVDDETKNRVNKARREAIAALAAVGKKPKKYLRGRYGI